MALIRIALVVRPAAGGIRRHVSLLLSHLNPAEFTPMLFAPADFTCDPPIAGTAQEILSIGPRTSLAPDLRAILQLSRRLRGRFDLVHAHGLRGALIGVPAARRAGIPALFTAHNLVPPTDLLQRWLLRFLSRNALVIAVSHAVAATLMAQGVPADRVKIVPNGIDLAQFDGSDLDEASRRTELLKFADRDRHPDPAAWLRSALQRDRPLLCIGGIGRMAPEKGFDVLITAFRKLRAQPPREVDPGRVLLIIAGSGPQDAIIRRAAVRTPGIILPGFIPDAAMLLSLMDIVAVPSRQEGQGIVALEAMAARKPIVASNVGGLVETIIDGETGLLVPPDDPQALCEALSMLLQSPERRIRMGAAGRARVEQNYTLDRMISELSTLYRVVGRKQ